MNSINLCRGWLWSVKRIKGPSARVDGAENLSWKRLPGKPSSFSTAVVLKGNTRPRLETSLRQSRTGMRHFFLIILTERENREKPDFLERE